LSILLLVRNKTLFAFLGILVFTTCVKPFIPNFSSPITGYLVVEGLVNSGLGSTSIRLSRSTALTDTLIPPPELGALVTVEGNNGDVFSLADQGNGTYLNAHLNLDHTISYRLHIKTKNGKEYYSDNQVPLKTSPIDSLGWTKDNTGVNINLYSQGKTAPQNYHISYTQVYEIVSLDYSKFIYQSLLDTVVARDRSELPQLYTCWNTKASDSVLLVSTQSLQFPYPLKYKLVHIPMGTIPLSNLYSIQAEIYAMNNKAYTFFQALKTSSEPSSSLFNPLPGQAKGNIYNPKDASETVIGYVSFADLEQKRIFISNLQVYPWNYNPVCPISQVVYLPDNTHHIDQKIKAINSDAFAPFDIIDSVTSSRFTYYVAPISCLDCRVYGSPVKPDFWPN